MQSMDVTKGNVAKVAALFPQCVTERIGMDGKVELAIDFEKLQAELSNDILAEGEERYQFTWPDKRAASRLANESTNLTLRPCREESVDFDTTENLYIEGDNLDVLKVLRETYLGKVKMIYIDPPYNTGKEFVYDDNRIQSIEEYIPNSGQFDEKGNQLGANTRSDGRFHTKWLNFIYPRLKVSRDLLTDNGVIFISIDDHEVRNLKIMADEVFGESNFIGQLILKTATDNNPSQINTEHEYMLCYVKNSECQLNWMRQSEAAQAIIHQYRALKMTCSSIEEIQKKLRLWIKANKTGLAQVEHYNNVDDSGVYSSSSNSSNPHPGGYMYDIIHPITHLPCPKPANGWRWPEKTFLSYDREKQIEWGKDHTTQPHVKKRIETAVEYLRSLIYEDNRATTKQLADLFDGKKIFDNPKPTKVLYRIIDFVTDRNSIILDFFSGSATTAHAIMQLNADDDGKRKYIMVQLPELTDVKSEAFKAGYKNICEIGKERIRRAGKKIKKENGLLAQDIDTGFRVLKLDSSNMEDVFYSPDKFEPTLLDGLLDNIKPDRSGEDLLFQVMLDLGIELSAKIERKEVAGKEVFSVDDDYLIACFDTDVDETVIEEMAKLLPTHLVIRDASASSDNVLDNFDQIVESYSNEKKINIHIL